MNFTAIDFETATGQRNSACAVGIVTVENGLIAEEYYSLIQPPGNAYFGMNIAIHGIRPEDTRDAPTFGELYPEIKARLHIEPWWRITRYSTALFCAAPWNTTT